MSWTSGPLRLRNHLPLSAIALTFLLILTGPSSVRAQLERTAVIRVTAIDESDKPVLGAMVEIKLKGSVVATAATNAKGEVEFAKLAAETYEVAICKHPFEPFSHGDEVL